MEDNTSPTYAVTKSLFSTFRIMKKKMMVSGETPKCVIQELGYCITSIKDGVVDPLSLVLILSDEEKRDPRVSKAVQQMLEEYVW